MSKKIIILIMSLILVIGIVLALLFLLPKNNKTDGDYYIKVNDGNDPGSTYTLNIDKDGNYKMNEHFSAALSTGIEEKDTDYSGTFSASTMDKIYSISKKIDETKDGYILYIEPDVDFEDGKWYASAQLVRAISFIDSKDKTYNEYGNCILAEINKLDIKDMPKKLHDNIYDNCTIKNDDTSKIDLTKDEVTKLTSFINEPDSLGFVNVSNKYSKPEDIDLFKALRGVYSIVNSEEEQKAVLNGSTDGKLKRIERSYAEQVIYNKTGIKVENITEKISGYNEQYDSFYATFGGSEGALKKIVEGHKDGDNYVIVVAPDSKTISNADKTTVTIKVENDKYLFVSNQ